MDIDAPRPGKAGQTTKTVGYYVAFVALGLVMASLGPTLPGLAKQTRTDLSEISFLFTVRALGYLLGSVQGGRLYDRVPGHPLMATGLLLMGAMMVLAPLMPLLWLLAAVLLVLGAAEGTLDVGGNILLVWVHSDKVGPFMAGLHFFFGVGAFLSPIIVAQAVLVSGSITWAYWALALLTLPAVVWLLRLPSTTAQTTAEGNPAGQVAHRPTGDVGEFGQTARQGLLVALLASFFFLYVGAEAGFAGWIFTYATALDLTGKTAAAYLTSAFWGALTLGRLLAIPIAARVRPRSILLGSLIGCLASVGLVLLWPTALAATWLGTLGLGLSMASVFPTTLSLAERQIRLTGRVTRWFFVGGSAGGMSLPWMIGQLFESIGPRVTMFAIMIDLILAVVVFSAIMLYPTQPATSSGTRPRDP
jgi:FHS family Na+ dependent glucose MFS transporter 1